VTQLKHLAKFVVSIGLCIAIVWVLGPQRMWAALAPISPATLLAALPLMALGVLITVRRWQVVLDVQGSAIAYPLLLRVYVKGLFFNVLGLGGIGGYTYRVMVLARHTGSGGVSAASVLAERAVDFAALPIIACVGAASFALAAGRYDAAAVLAGVGVLLTLFLWRVIASGRTLLEHGTEWLWGRPAPRFIRDFGGALVVLARRPGAIRRLLGLSCLFQAAVILVNYTISWNLGFGISLIQFVALMPFVALLVNAAPVALGGLGTTQAAYVYIFRLGDIEAGKALALSVVITAGVFVFAAIGGAVLVSERIRLRGML